MKTHKITPNCTRTTHIFDASHPRLPSTVTSPDVRLEIAVDEYLISNSSKNALTLVFTHGTSFNKALWEPTISRLLNTVETTGVVRRILALDATNHGESWLLNAERLTGNSHWPDQSRDILAALKHFKVQQPVVGIGHSFGGGILCHATFMDPRVFTATILVEPILFRMEAQDAITANRALKRRDRWDNIEDVNKVFKEHKAFSDWHPEVLSLHIKHSTTEVRDNETSARVLTTPKEQEAATYIAAPFPQLPEHLAGSQQVHYFILGEKSVVVPKSDREWIQSISKPPGRVKVMHDAGHLIPMTHPDQLASDLGKIVSDIWDREGRRMSKRVERL